MSIFCVTKSEAGKLLGVSLRMVTNYLQSGELTIDHKDGNKVMIRVDEVFSLREQKRKRRVITMAITTGFTREAWIEKRIAEGFTVEQAQHEYDDYTDPTIAKAQEQKVTTRGEMLEQIHEAIQANPDKAKLYKPDFKLSAEYTAISEEIEKAQKNVDYKLVQELNKKRISIQVRGTVTEEERQAEIDKTLEMPIASVLAERKKYEAIVVDCEEKIDNFDVSPIQTKVDELVAEYQTKINKARDWHKKEALAKECDEEINKLELPLITIPLNNLALKRYRAKEFFFIYEARVKLYVLANKEIIKEEIQRAKHEEVIGSLADLAGYVER